jgi:hypothetical protein
MNARLIGILLCVASAACASAKGAAGDAGTGALDAKGPPAQGSASLHLTATAVTPTAVCIPGPHWVNVPFATQGGQQLSASSRGALAVDGEGQMDVSCSVTSTGSQFDVTAALVSRTTGQPGGPLGPTTVQLSTTIASDQADAPGTLEVQDDQTVTTYASQDCVFSVHPAAAGDQLAVTPGRIWASVACRTVRDQQSSNPNDVCRIESGYFVLENCAQ